MIVVENLSKRFAGTKAVSDLSFGVRPGIVTGFLGPNGAGKTTTMRVIMGLETPTSGRATICGLAYRDLPVPLEAVGALLDARAAHPGRDARSHLAALAAASRLPKRRVDEVLALVGLEAVAGRRAGTFSLGMGQTARHSRRVARRPCRPAVRRADQRLGPRGDPVDPQPDEKPGRRGAGRSWSRRT